MIEEIETFFNHCIVRELKNHYQVEFNNNMFPTLAYYTDASTVLVKNGFQLESSMSGFTLKKGCTTMGTFSLGVFSACFLNKWIEDSGIDGISGFPVGFSKTEAKTRQGALARMSEAFNTHAAELGMTPAQADFKAVEKFLSMEVTNQGKEGLFIFPEAEVLSKDDFVDEDEEGRVKVVFADEDDVPFYFAINMKKRGKIPAKLPGPWMAAIDREGLSHNYAEGVLYVSNTVGAAMGLPPAPAHLGVAKLELTLEDWDATEITPKAQSPVSILSSQVQALDTPARGLDDTDCETKEALALAQQFLDSPGRATYNLMMQSASVSNTFLRYNKKPEYKMGSNKNMQTSAIRENMLGITRAKTFADYARLVLNVAAPKTTMGVMVLLMRLNGLLRGEEEVYFATQP